MISVRTSNCFDLMACLLLGSGECRLSPAAYVWIPSRRLNSPLSLGRFLTFSVLQFSVCSVGTIMTLPPGVGKRIEGVRALKVLGTMPHTESASHEH